MKSIIGVSKSSDVKTALQEAMKELQSPKAIVFMTSYDKIQETAFEIQKKYPQAQSIGTSGTMFAQGEIYENGLVIMAFEKECDAVAGVMKELSGAPIKYVGDVENNVKKIAPGMDNTVCMEFCTGFEEKFVTTMNAGFGKNNIGLIGGTVFGYPAGVTGKVACNGQIYENAACYILIKNLNGKAKIYKQNIYGADNKNAHIVTKVNHENKELTELDYRPAADVYSQEFNLPKDKIIDNVLVNPMGRTIGDEVYISSMHTLKPNGALLNYKRLNRNDTVYFLNLLDYQKIMDDTIQEIEHDFRKVSAFISVDCIYRYMLMQKDNTLLTYLKKMSSVGPSIGIVCGGEQFKEQHVNQTMVCVVFE